MQQRTMPLFAAIAVVLTAASSPVFAQGMPRSNQFWWPEQLDLSPLRD